MKHQKQKSVPQLYPSLGKSIFLGVLIFKKHSRGWALVAYSCNTNYSGGRDQEDQGSKPAQANSSRDPIWKNPI
jgi:hypothetical protein